MHAVNINTLEIRTAYNLNNLLNDPDWIEVAPGDMSIFRSLPAKYIKIDNNKPVEKNQAEKDQADADEAAAFAAAEEDMKDITVMFDKLLKAFSLVVLDEINILRSEHSLSERTIAQLKSAVKTKYESL